MTTACIVQARIASTRLPAKVLKDLAGEPVLGHVLRRCKAIPGVDVVVCTTVDNAECAAIENLAKNYDTRVHRGSETDVLDRYLGAARLVEADEIVRVTSDCPLIDPALCGDRVEVPDELRLVHRMTGGSGPDVRPDAVLAPPAEQKPDDLAAVDRDRAGGILPLRLDLRAEVRDVRQQRLDRQVRSVSLGQHGRGAVQVLVGEGHDVHGP